MSRREVDPLLPEESAADEPLPPRRVAPIVLFDEAGLLVVDKPAGVGFETLDDDAPGLCDLLGLDGGEPAGPFEPEASGGVLLTRDGAAPAVEIAYLALVRGAVREESGRISAPLRQPNTPGGKVRVDAQRGKPAATAWRLIEAFASFSLLECVPDTAARHQPRVHLAAAGMPLAVDAMYAGESALRLSTFKKGYRPSRRHEERPLIARPSLHAAAVSFVHPERGTPVRIEIEPAKDFRATLQQLRKFGRIA